MNGDGYCDRAGRCNGCDVTADCDVYLATHLTPGPPALEPGEQITTLPATWPEAKAMIAGGRIVDAKTVAGLLYWATFVRG